MEGVKELKSVRSVSNEHLHSRMNMTKSSQLEWSQSVTGCVTTRPPTQTLMKILYLSLLHFS